MSSIARTVQEQVQNFQLGHIFSVDEFESLGQSTAVYQELHRLKLQGRINRIQNGVYYKPEPNRILKGRFLSPDIYEAVKVVAKKNGESVQIHGGMAANRLGLSTQVPVMEVFYTSGNSREFMIGGTRIRMIHTKNVKFFQYPLNHRVGLAISALLFQGKEIVNAEMIEKLKKTLSVEELMQLKQSSLPAWLHKVLNNR